MKKIKVMNILLIFMMLQNSLSAWLPKQQVKRSKKSKSSKKGEIFSKKSLTGEPVKGAQATLTTGKVSQQKQASPSHAIQSQNTQNRINLVKKVIKDPAAKTEAFATGEGTLFVTRNAQGKVVHSIQQFKNGRSIETIISQKTGSKEFINYDSHGKVVNKVNRQGLILTPEGNPTGYTLTLKVIAAVGNKPQVSTMPQQGFQIVSQQSVGQQGVALSGVPVTTTSAQIKSVPISKSLWESSRKSALNMLQRSKEIFIRPKKDGKVLVEAPAKKLSMRERVDKVQHEAASGLDMLANVQWSGSSARAEKRTVGRKVSGLIKEGDFALNAAKKQFNKILGTKFKVHEGRNTAMTRLAIQRKGKQISEHQKNIDFDKQTIEQSQVRLKTEKNPFLREHLEKTINHKKEQVRLRESEIFALQGQRTTLMGTKFDVEGYKHAPAVVV